MGVDTTIMIAFLVILPVLSFLYASVGHGGASGYLALMALFSIPNSTMKQTALLLNLFVAGIAFYQYQKVGYFKKSIFIPFAIGSIPAAFIGGMIDVNPLVYKKILGILLLFAIARMLWKRNHNEEDIKRNNFLPALIIGLMIGFFSGLIGIGGGIILTPVILLLHWGSMKEAAAVSALFIWVNSAAGLLGQFSSGVHLYPMAGVMVVVAVIGGLAGSYVGSKKWNNRILEYCLATVLITASIKLLVF